MAGDAREGLGDGWAVARFAASAACAGEVLGFRFRV